MQSTSPTEKNVAKKLISYPTTFLALIITEEKNVNMFMTAKALYKIY